MRKTDTPCDQRGSAAASYLKGTNHKYYEDSFRMLPRDISLVKQKKRGELFAVFDGIGSAPEGRHAAQEIAESLLRFFREPDAYSASLEGIKTLLMEANLTIHQWGFMPGTDRPLGGCAGTVMWLIKENLYIFHAGDTAALLIRDGKGMELTKPHQTSDGAIYRYFGLGSDLQIDIECFQIEESDRILLLTDGMTKVIHPVKAVDIIEQYIDLPLAVKTLVQRSRTMGSIDDITAMLIQVEEIWE
jgi:PPM family protein phosphatase